MCHLVLLMPVFGLAVFLFLPLPYAAAIYLVICAASALLYRAVVRAMCRRVVTGTEALLGAQASVRRGSIRAGWWCVCAANCGPLVPPVSRELRTRARR